MNTESEQTIQRFYARIAGLSYVIFTIAGLVKNFFLNTRLAAVGTTELSSIFENELHYRLGIFAEIVMFLGVVMASVSFYIVLKSVCKQLALTALCLRLIEIITGGLAVVVGISLVALANRASMAQLFNTEQLQTIAVVMSNVIVPAYEYSWIPMGFAGVITFYLLYKVSYIPRAWSVWGMVTYTSLILYPLAKLLIPELPREAVLVLFPGALFELGVGIWLLLKGVNIPSNNSKAANQSIG